MYLSPFPNILILRDKDMSGLTQVSTCLVSTYLLLLLIWVKAHLVPLF